MGFLSDKLRQLACYRYDAERKAWETAGQHCGPELLIQADSFAEIQSC